MNTKTVAYHFVLSFFEVVCVFFFLLIVKCRHLPCQNNGNQQSHSHATYRNVQIKAKLLIIHRELGPWLVFSSVAFRELYYSPCLCTIFGINTTFLTRNQIKECVCILHEPIIVMALSRQQASWNAVISGSFLCLNAIRSECALAGVESSRANSRQSFHSDECDINWLVIQLILLFES